MEPQVRDEIIDESFWAQHKRLMRSHSKLLTESEAERILTDEEVSRLESRLKCQYRSVPVTASHLNRRKDDRQ